MYRTVLRCRLLLYCLQYSAGIFSGTEVAIDYADVFCDLIQSSMYNHRYPTTPSFYE